MHEVDAVRALVLERAERLPPEILALTSMGLNQILAEDIAADGDSPAFDKSIVDGYAVSGPGPRYRIVEAIAAGSTSGRVLRPGEAARIFTGAPLPDGADAVAKQELARVRGEELELPDGAATAKYILPRGTEWKAGDVVVPAGTALNPIAFGLFASVGRTAVRAYPRPQVAVIPTGDELVEANTKPHGSQLRNSNGPMLVAQAVRAGALPRYLGIGRDDEAILENLLLEGLLTTHVVVVAGGASVGDFDLVPKVLAKLGVDIHVRSVRMKPGKPLLFGTKGRVLVFGLPGNPVSSHVGFELFVKPAIAKLRGAASDRPRVLRLPLAEALAASNDRPTYHPAIVSPPGGDRTATPIPWFGSANLKALLHANGLIVLPPGEVKLAAGTAVDVLYTHG